jgi:hypothetical protein
MFLSFRSQTGLVPSPSTSVSFDVVSTQLSRPPTVRHHLSLEQTSISNLGYYSGSIIPSHILPCAKTSRNISAILSSPSKQSSRSSLRSVRASTNRAPSCNISAVCIVTYISSIAWTKVESIAMCALIAFGSIPIPFTIPQPIQIRVRKALNFVLQLLVGRTR